MTWKTSAFADSASHAQTSLLALDRPPPIRLTRRGQRVVVAVAFDRGSAQGLVRGHLLSRELGLELVVAHVLPSPPAAATRHQHSTLLISTAIAIQLWALHQAGVPLSTKDIHVFFGEIATQLTAAACVLDAELLVIGGRTSIDGGPGVLTDVIARLAPCALLVAGPERASRTMVVATDLAHEKVPVVRVAAELADRLRRRLSLVHNIELASNGSADALTELRKNVAQKLDTLRGVVRDFGLVDDATVTRELHAADGILRVARARDVDMIIVGARAKAGATSGTILSKARRSVLVVPLSS